ncbi:MAG TPA: T9SS type A sorting domain-containing protein [Bacteroidia bacterium]|jgi:hypothetical protein|nr:T9SS type A sorting domain-containing protein [Bacteroidia bacterium]
MKRNLLLTIFFFVSAMNFSFAQCTIDQNQPQNDGGTSERNLPGYYDWQSFTAGMTGVLCRVDVLFCNSNTQLNGTGIVKIYDGTGIGGTLLATDTVTVNGTAYNLNTPFWQMFFISSFPAVVSGQVYTWEFIPIQGGGLPDPYLIQINIPDVYSGGISYNFGTNGDIAFATYVDVATGMNSSLNENGFAVYPLPTHDVVTVDANVSLLNEKYSIYDETGRVVMEGIFDAEKPVIDVHTLSPGIYFLKAGEMGVRKVVKQ